MSIPTNTRLSRLLSSPGWDECVEAKLLRKSDTWHTRGFRSHWHTLRRLFDDIKVDAVLCIESRPTVCLIDSTQRSSFNVEETRKELWNLGATTLLIVEMQSQVRVFSTLTPPAKDDLTSEKAHLTDETIQGLELTELALRVQKFTRRVETGAIYREHKSLFDPKNTVDQRLLKNLKTTRDLICPSISVEGYRRAHALIGKFLFSCYLLDRGIIGPAYLRKNRLPEADDMLGFLAIQFVDAGYTLSQLFRSLQRDFNGSLFGDQYDDGVKDSDVDYLRRFLTGEDMQSGQMSLFKVYDFSFIPVELISSIYQEFLGAEADAESSLSGNKKPGKNGQRKQGAYYTPPRLAELTVDIATEEWDTLLNKRCLDPACGSGIFLVILFVRMAEEWRYHNPNATTEHRYSELKRLLSENISGVDIHHTACLVTCFSLYLAFLDQMDPKEIIKLREALDRDVRTKLLPRILWEKGENRPQSYSIRELDFFEMPVRREFNLVLGNPPWVSRRSAPTAEEWLFSEKQNPAARGLPKAGRDQALFPAKELSCAFMWKAGLHLREAGRVCQVLPSRVFLSNNTDRFQSAWLKAHRIEAIWLLADYSFVLFPGADCPAFIGRYHPRRDEESPGKFTFISPKVELLDPREGLIPVQPDDQKTLNEADIIAAADRDEAAYAWKKHHWGTPRDQRLIERLMRYPKLDALCVQPPQMKRDTPGNRATDDGKRWYRGQGFQPLTAADFNGNTGDPETGHWPIWWDSSHKFLRAAEAPDGLVLLDSDQCKTYGSGPRTVRRSVAPELCKAPLLIVNKAFTKFLCADFDVLFQDDFQSISAPKSDENELLFLTAVLSSPLVQYLLFHTTANIGVERDIARLTELLQLPFPPPEHTDDEERSQSIIRECADMLRTLRHDLLKPHNLLSQADLIQQTKVKLAEKVYDYFEICDWERYLIEDTVNLFRPSSTPPSYDSDTLLTCFPSRAVDREEYTATLVSTFQGWSGTQADLWTEICVATKVGLALMTFGVGKRTVRYSDSSADENIEDLLRKIRQSAARPAGTVFQCLRGFAYYEGAKVHVIKPLNRRHWTRTAALNDADSILTQMMNEEGWGA